MNALEMRGVGKVFGAFRALDSVDLTLRPGEVHVLLGENGAGKSTLIKIMTGALTADSGTITFEGNEIRPRTPQEAQDLGIACVYQEVNLLPNLSVAENVVLGRAPKKFGTLDWREAHRRAKEALAVLNLDIDVRLPLSSYSIAIQQMVAIARAVSMKARVLVLDEPTSSLDEAEVRSLFDVMRRLRGEGIAIVFITHFLDQVDEIADRITILRNGQLVGEFLPAGLTRIELIAKMVGKELGALATHGASAESAGGTALIESKGLKKGRVGPVDFEVRKGETVGLAGLLGSGRTETVRMLFALDKPDSGSVTIGGTGRHLKSPRSAMLAGLAFLPEDRKLEAIIPSLSIRENVVLALQAKRGWLKKISRKEAEEIAEKYRSMLSIATESIEKPIGQLSGGNQQKVIIGRWLATEPSVLILDEPTRGIDIGARDEIERLIAKLCDDGIGVLMISSEIDELVRCSDRFVVMREGQMVGELPSGASAEQIMRLIAGGAQ